MADSQWTEAELAEIDEKIGGKYTIAGYALSRGYTAEVVLIAFFLFKGETLDVARELAAAANLNDLKETLKVDEYEAGMAKWRELESAGETADEAKTDTEIVDDATSDKPVKVLARDEKPQDVPRPKVKKGDNSQWTAAQVAHHFNQGWEPNKQHPAFTWQSVMLMSIKVVTPTIAKVSSMADIEAHPDVLGPNTRIFFKVVSRKIQSIYPRHPYYLQFDKQDEEGDDLSAASESEASATGEDVDSLPGYGTVGPILADAAKVAAEVEQRRADTTPPPPSEQPATQMMGEELYDAVVPGEGDSFDSEEVRRHYYQLLRSFSERQIYDLLDQIAAHGEVEGWRGVDHQPLRYFFMRVVRIIITLNPKYQPVKDGYKGDSKKEQLKAFMNNMLTLAFMLVDGEVSSSEYRLFEFSWDNDRMHGWLNRHRPGKPDADEVPDAPKPIEAVTPPEDGSTDGDDVGAEPAGPSAPVASDDVSPAPSEPVADEAPDKPEADAVRWVEVTTPPPPAAVASDDTGSDPAEPFAPVVSGETEADAADEPVEAEEPPSPADDQPDIIFVITPPSNSGCNGGDADGQVPEPPPAGGDDDTTGEGQPDEAFKALLAGLGAIASGPDPVAEELSAQADRLKGVLAGLK